MSNPNPSDQRNHPDKIASNNKVIVLSMKNMPSYKYDPKAESQSIFGFNTKLTQQSSQQISSSPPKVHVVQQQPPASSSLAKIGPPATILIRSQSASTANKSHFTTLTSCPNVKIQETPALTSLSKNISTTKASHQIITFPQTLVSQKTGETTFRTEKRVIMKSSTGHHLLLPTSALNSHEQSASKVFVPGLTKIAPKLPPTQLIKSVPNPHKIDAQKMILQQVVVPTQQKSKTAVITLPTSGQSFARFNAKWLLPGPPALTLIQPRPQIADVSNDSELVQEEKNEEASSEDGDYLDEQVLHENVEKTPVKLQRTASDEARLLEVKRIIEGDQDEIEQQIATIKKQSIKSAEVDIDEENEEDVSVYITAPEMVDSSSSMLLCDEIIESISTEVSPVDSEKSKDTGASPADGHSEGSEQNPAVLEVRKNLSRKLSIDCDKENIEITIEEESDTDNESRVELQRQTDYEDTLMKSEIAKSVADHTTPMVTSLTQGKAKRVRKPKNPTIIATLGLPYKPSQPSNRKSKIEKKLEFELDFHDPINKILWDDGIGGLDNCNKLFGFDEFGLIEVLNKKDATAKLKQLDVKDVTLGKDDSSKYKLRKITDPADQYVCVVCTKQGTIRDFYLPEACSEACLAITKRKDFGLPAGKESSSESGLTTPVDERKLMFGGEMVPLQQLQQHLLEQTIPISKRKRTKKRVELPSEAKFQWDTYLSTKSVPASVDLFKNPYPRLANPFKVGMKLEAIDPENQKMFCVCSVEEKLGYRIKLHFDGYSPSFDFWVNADSPNIFPSGFCNSTNRVLQTPPKWNNKKFDWSEYLDHTNTIGAQRSLFPRFSKVSLTENPFELGMKLETMRDGKLYAASIIDILEDRVLVSPDGHEELGCVWLDIYSPYLHPCNYHNTIEDPECFIPPSRPFEWADYLESTTSKEAPSEFLYFRTRSPFEFEAGLKLEVVDKVNRQLIRPATVLNRSDYKVQVIFDGFDIGFAFWIDDDSDDLHPINWCEKTGHPIEHPAGFSKSADNGLCPTAGCRGIGNGIFTDRYFHDNVQECPYSKSNWKKLTGRNLGSHLDSKIVVKRGIKQANATARDAIDLKQEVKDDRALETNDETSSETGKNSKRKGRKRKAPTTGIEVDEKPLTMTNISKTFLEDYGPQLSYSYELWKKNSKILDRAEIDGGISGNPLDWNVTKVCSFIKKITSDPTTTEKFQDQEIDGTAFVALSQNDLVSLLDIKMGVAIKIYNRILHLREEIMLKFAKI